MKAIRIKFLTQATISAAIAGGVMTMALPADAAQSQEVRWVVTESGVVTSDYVRPTDVALADAALSCGLKVSDLKRPLHQSGTTSCQITEFATLTLTEI